VGLMLDLNFNWINDLHRKFCHRTRALRCARACFECVKLVKKRVS
jgi:hypothetical protein